MYKNLKAGEQFGIEKSSTIIGGSVQWQVQTFGIRWWLETFGWGEGNFICFQVSFAGGGKVYSQT